MANENEDKKLEPISLDELFTALQKLGVTNRFDTIKKMNISMTDPRLDWKSHDLVIRESIKHTLPGAIAVSELDGYVCERVAIPMLGILELSGPDVDIMEEVTHVLCQGIALAFGTYFERIIPSALDIEGTVDALVHEIRREIMTTIVRAAKAREAREEKEAQAGDRQ